MATEPATTIRQSELRMRILSAVVLAPVALAAELLGGLAFAALVTIMAAIAFWEWTAMTGASEPLSPRALVLACLAAGLMALSFDMTDLAVGLLALPAFLALAAGFLFGPARWLGYGHGVCRFALRGPHRIAAGGAAWLGRRSFHPPCCVGDGYRGVFRRTELRRPQALGARLGRRKRGRVRFRGWRQASSPEALLVWLADAGRISTGLLLAAPLSIAAQAGDLMESAVKRHFDVKDSGKIIPGHGGVLDRVDGLFAAAALAWLIAGIGIGGDILALPREIVTARAQ